MAVEQSSPSAGITVAGLAASLFAQFYAAQLTVIVPGVSVVEPVASFLFMSLLAGWIVRDSEARGQRKPYDFDTMVAFLWMLVLPLYLVRTRRWRGVLILSAAIIAAILGHFVSWRIVTIAWEKSF